MKWIKITKDPSNLPSKGTYHDWKEQLALEGHHQCVYCAIHENLMGGIRNFHVEHYRPRKWFKAQENDYLNLYYACPICNTFKGSDWPNEPQNDHSIAAYPNPSEVDYNVLFKPGAIEGYIEGINIAATYIQEKLYLNRPQLVIQRRIDFILNKVREETQTISGLLNDTPTDSEKVKYYQIFTKLIMEVSELQSHLRKIPHYRNQDIEKV